MSDREHSRDQREPRAEGRGESRGDRRQRKGRGNPAEEGEGLESFEPSEEGGRKHRGRGRGQGTLSTPPKRTARLYIGKGSDEGMSEQQIIEAALKGGEIESPAGFAQRLNRIIARTLKGTL